MGMISRTAVHPTRYPRARPYIPRAIHALGRTSHALSTRTAVHPTRYPRARPYIPRAIHAHGRTSHRPAPSPRPRLHRGWLPVHPRCPRSRTLMTQSARSLLTPIASSEACCTACGLAYYGCGMTPAPCARDFEPAGRRRACACCAGLIAPDPSGLGDAATRPRAAAAVRRFRVGHVDTAQAATGRHWLAEGLG